MKTSKSKLIKESKRVTIKTNLLEILQALTSQTRDDGAVVESWPIFSLPTGCASVRR